MDLPSKIKHFREKKDLTQEKLAEELFLSRKTVSSWENGHSFPDFGTLVKLSKILEVPLNILVEDEDDSVIDHFDNEDKIAKKDARIAKTTYYLNFVFLIFGYIDLFRPLGMRIPLMSIVLLINMIILLSHYSNWDNLKKGYKIFEIIGGFMVFLILNVLTLTVNSSFKEGLPHDVWGIVGATAGEFILIFFITISWLLVFFFYPSKDN